MKSNPQYNKSNPQHNQSNPRHNPSHNKINQINHFVFHQASKIVLDQLISKLNIPQDKFHKNYHEIGNTVSASIPMLLEQLVYNKVLKKNDLIMMLGFGVGLSAAACIIEWHK